jgi:putative DNA primase/helicase
MPVADDDFPFEEAPPYDALPDGPSNVFALPGALPSEVSEDSIALAFTREHGATMRFDHDAGRWFQWSTTHWRSLTVPAAFHYAREIGRRMAAGKKTMCKASVAGGAERFARAALWLKVLRDATLGVEQMITYLQRVAGYCLTGLTTEHALFFIYGSGGNGKSVFLNTLVHILGDYAISAPMDTFTSSKFSSHPTELAMLKGARLVTASETEEGRSWAESRIKALTGGDPITARFMAKDFFTYQPHFKLLFAGNHQPTLNAVDPAMRRRFNMLPFIHKPAEPDHMLEERLKAEAPRILAWALQGCLDWQKHGLGRPDSVTVATDEYFDDQDVFGQWVDEHCKKGRSERATCPEPPSHSPRNCANSASARKRRCMARFIKGLA